MAGKSKKSKTTEVKHCPISREEFMDETQRPGGGTILDKIADSVALNVKESTASGGFGWSGTGKVSFRMGEVVVPCQVGINVTVIHSANGKAGEGEAPETSETAPESAPADENAAAAA